MPELLFAFIGGMPSHVELIFIAFIALLLFGNRLPSAMRSLGRSVVEFKKGVKGIEDEVDGAMKTADQTAATSAPTKEKSSDA